MNTLKTILAVLLAALLLTFSAAADNTVTQTVDENGNPVTIVTDENGNQTIITDVTPGQGDITVVDDDAGLDAPDRTAQGSCTVVNIVKEKIAEIVTFMTGGSGSQPHAADGAAAPNAHAAPDGAAGAGGNAAPAAPNGTAAPGGDDASAAPADGSDASAAPDGSDASAAPDGSAAPAAQSAPAAKRSGNALLWLVPLDVAACAAALWLFLRYRRGKKS